jgi:hypothetical protein
MSKIQKIMAAHRAASAVKKNAPEIRLNCPTEDVEKISGENSQELK